MGFVYSGPLASPHDPKNFTSFEAKTPEGGSVYNTFLHSWSGRLVAGNYTLTDSAAAIALNTGLDSGAFVYDTVTGQQTNLIYGDGAASHTAYGIWHNGRNRYTNAGGSSVANPDIHKLGQVGEALGAATLIDYDRVTGQVRHQRNYQYNNGTNSGVVTHFEGINYAGRGIYQMPFLAVTNDGVVAGNAYVKRLRSGQFSSTALWQPFSSTAGSVTSNDSTAGLGATGLINTGSAVVPYASMMTRAAYGQLLNLAQSLV